MALGCVYRAFRSFPRVSIPNVYKRSTEASMAL
nr:MAG TPA: hypothetical protein [Caudoviricetes sp.]